MQFMIFHSLAFDIVVDGVLIAMVSKPASTVTVSLELSSPPLLFHFWTAPEHLSCGHAFYHQYDRGYALCWNRVNKKMHMILIGATL
jgi:hypothetical protein